MKQILLMIGLVALVGCGTTRDITGAYANVYGPGSLILHKSGKCSISNTGKGSPNGTWKVVRGELHVKKGRGAVNPASRDFTIVFKINSNDTIRIIAGISPDSRGRKPIPNGQIFRKQTNNVKIETAIRKSLKKPTGELTEADLEKVTILDLRSNQLTEVPNELEKLTQLKALNLQFNQLTDVKGLEKLAQLETLHLENNQLTNVKGVEKLTQLEVLMLGDNKLADIRGLEKLTQLTHLELDNTQLTEVPKEPENLKKLEYLSLENNQLTSVKGLEKLTQLRGLSLARNQLTDVKGLEKLTQLTRLHLNDNLDLTEAQIDELQKALPKCKISHDAKK